MGFREMYNSIGDFIKEVVYLMLGQLLGIFFFPFAILSIPVYLFRVFVQLLAKWRRPDLQEMLSPLSSALSHDLFTGRRPRGNVVVSIVAHGAVNQDGWRRRVMKNWIEAVSESTGKLKYPKFHQHVTKWLGFAFHKGTLQDFDIHNHLYFHDNGKKVTKEDVVTFTEKILNEPYHPERSPWEIHFISNYQNEELYPANEEMAVFLFKIHHSYADGYSILHALVESLFGHPISVEDMPEPRVKKRTGFEKLTYFLHLPFYTLHELAYELSQVFRPCPWRIPDQRKAWHQHCAKSKPIPIQMIKDVKNSFGTSFTAVLLTAISAGIHKNLMEKKMNAEFRPKDDRGKMCCLSPLPLPGHKKLLTNHVTAAFFEMPTTHFENPVDRLYLLEEIMEKTKSSLVPMLSQIFVLVAGSHLSFVTSWIVKKLFISTGLTNFPSLPLVVRAEGMEGMEVDFVVGAQEGSAGVTISVLSYNGNIIVGATAEKGLMTKEELSTFVSDIFQEIKLLEKLAVNKTTSEQNIGITFQDC